MQRVLDGILGRRLSTREEGHEQVTAVTGVPFLGLDALASASYGPEAALTMLIPLGAIAPLYLLPIIAVISVILAAVAMSYRQTIAAYPGGGGSFTVARENLGPKVGVVAGAALAIDYILNVAIAISAGVGAVVSAIPSLQAHTLTLCLVLLALLTLVNLRGIRQSAAVFAVPTAVFVVSLGLVIVVGVARAIASGGHPTAVVAPPAPKHAVEAVSAWLIIRAFANGTTAMTGVEAVADAVPVFRDPRIRRARRTLVAIVGMLIVLLIGIGYLCRAYDIAATEPGKAGYQSVLSMLTAAVFGHSAFYYVALASVLCILSLSANTSFADFPRVCRLLALEHHLPATFAERGRRLVFTRGIVLLAILSAALLVAFGGITDRLIPLFAIGALLAFTMSQAGMVAHWRRVGGKHARKSTVMNATGATATGITLVIVAISKFTEGAWLVIVVVPLVSLLLWRIRGYNERISEAVATEQPMAREHLASPVAVVVADAWNRGTRRALELALELSDVVYAVQITTDSERPGGLADVWDRMIACRSPDAAGVTPKLVVVSSPYRQFFTPIVELLRDLGSEYPDRNIAVIIPELEIGHWYERLLHNNRGRMLRAYLLANPPDRLVLVTTPYRVAA
ncbi:MAG: APC family permease [Kofleriaceae bacterium]|nr:APC family permease [Kofleriaceae bacterium]